MAKILPLSQLTPARFSSPEILKKLASASRQLAELKGKASSIPRVGFECKITSQL